MKTIRSAYNSQMRGAAMLCVITLTVALSVVAQQGHNDQRNPNTPLNLPKASLWGHYSVQLQPTGSNGPYRWRLASGELPHDLTLHDNGTLDGEVDQQVQAAFTVAETDRDGKQQMLHFLLATDIPLKAVWDKSAKINGNRIEGSVKVTNSTGRTFDLTYIVLAVNEIGRATAIGYQHFPLKPNTQDQELPFGETLSPGRYDVNVDVVGEESQSKMIFRTRLVAPKLEIGTGP